ncbi:PD-(D/E)XK nuclease family protein [Candidatus Magnetobacterium casense]|uniref:PD-(D/E)XK nuclease family protein n=1 Tax=Candidatus Magnetobacterium casense TaxID=1455061 RepID=A0ABS6S2S3_9BACT|nr:PD-(D/E)XK nuclease family protein [Candidatus Magnetobacterium casensis]MBV6343139.1 PD-(D/E)XK nuclease family protein [Candidatus Magnetobacterium casensis]
MTSATPLRLVGSLFGLEFEGECDNAVQLPDGSWWIDDTKFHSDYRMSRLSKEEVSPELRVQLSIYKILFEQMGKGQVTRLTASHMSPFFGFMVQEVPAMTEEEIGEVRPLGNPFTVRQIAGFYQNALAELHNPKYVTQSYETHAHKIADACPRVGLEMLKNKTSSWLCDHCNVREVCNALG